VKACSRPDNRGYTTIQILAICVRQTNSLNLASQLSNQQMLYISLIMILQLEKKIKSIKIKVKKKKKKKQEAMIILSITGGALFSMDSKTFPFPSYSRDMDFQLRPNHFPHSLCDKLYNLGVTFHPISPCLRLLSFFCFLSLVPFFLPF
jgi:mannitol-1-phosphate/altronate dehydrogenase